MSSFQERLAAGEGMVGLWLALADPYGAEIVASAGYDWLLIDAEHGPNDLRSVLAQLQVLAAYDGQPFVRLPHGDAALIKRYLDIGADHLLIPMVESPAQAKALVAATRYPPKGIRGVGAGLARASRWGADRDYLARANGRVQLWIQIESERALNNFEAIAQTPGLAGVFFGPADITASLGRLGTADDPEMEQRVLAAITQAKALGVPSGLMTGSERFLGEARRAGATLLGVGADTALLAAALRRHARTLKDTLA